MSIDTTTTAGKIAVMQAAEEGKQIQSKPKNANLDWVDNSNPSWHWGSYDYRIAPEPPKKKLVPWKAGVGLLGKRVTSKSGQSGGIITGFTYDGKVMIGELKESPEYLLAQCVEILEDGTTAPCGIEVEVAA